MFTHTATHATLLARVSGGEDPAAWAEFCDRYSTLIRAFSRRQGLQDSDIDDIHQEVLLGLTRSMPGFRYDPARGKFRSYLKTIVLHAIFKKRCQTQPGLSLDQVEEHTRVAAGDAGVDEHWEAEWRQYHIRTALHSLRLECGENDAAAFERYAVRGEDARQVAEALGMSVDQVYQAKSRLLKRLTALIERQVEEEG